MTRKSLSALLALVAAFLFSVVGCEPLVSKDCVVMLGDSIFALSGAETEFLEELSGDAYRHYYISGAEMVGGLVDSIPEQYQDAIGDGPVRTVIFDGGGNDILIGGQAACSTPYGGDLSASCIAILNDVWDATNDMIEDMIADGVENIIMQGYYYTDDEDLWQVLDVSTEQIIADFAAMNAANPDVNIIFVDMRPHFPQGGSSHTTDGIHPTRASSELLANLLWDVMVANEIEQGEECPVGGCGS